MGLDVLYEMISKLKFYSKYNYEKTLHFKSVLLFSSIFNQSVLPPAELDSTAPLLFLTTSRTTSLYESHRGIPLQHSYSFCVTILKLWNMLLNLWNTTIINSNYGTLHSFKSWDTKTCYSYHGTLQKSFIHNMRHTIINYGMHNQSNVLFTHIIISIS